MQQHKDLTMGEPASVMPHLQRDLMSARYLVHILLIGSAYFLVAKFGLSLAFSTKQVTALWPPTGIALAALLIAGYRVWPAIFVAAFAINALVGGSLWVAAAIAVGNTLAPLCGSFCLNRLISFNSGLKNSRDVLALIFLGAIGGMLISASSGTAVLAVAGIVPWSAFGSVWWVWWVGDGMGVLVFAPLVLSWIAQPELNWNRAQRIELGGIFSGLLISSSIALLGVFSQSSVPFQLQYAIFPFVIWISMRFGIRETTLAIAVVVGFAVWGAIHDQGPFTIGNLDQRLILLEMFIAVVTVTGLMLSATTTERAAAQLALQAAHDHLEERVRERTEKLAQTNRVLAQKNEEVEAFVYIVSHDLRAPLVNLQGFSKELELSCSELTSELDSLTLPASSMQKIKTVVDEGIIGSLRYISASSTKFQKLIDALLLLSRTGKNEYVMEHIDVASLVESTLNSLQQSIRDTGTEITVGSLPQAVGDLTAIGQVFSNLISNAMKYLQPGRPGKIEIGGQREHDMVHYFVRDNGAGIPVSSQARLFQVFQRFHPKLASGEGMGLAIIKRIVERHGGAIHAVSEEGVGTTFHFSLPAVVQRSYPAQFPE